MLHTIRESIFLIMRMLMHYGQAETVVGKAIKDLPREALVLSSKVFWPTMPGPNGRGLSRKHMTESLNASLKRMGFGLCGYLLLPSL